MKRLTFFLRPFNYPRLEIIFVVVFITVYSLAAISVSLNRYWQYDAFWYDLGIFDTTVWKWSRFELPVIAHLAPPLGKLVWADHFNPTIIFLSPVYWLTSRTEIILVTQVVAVAISTLIAYLTARRVVSNSLVRVTLLGFVGLQNALYTDVHNIVFALPLVMAVIWALVSKKWRWYWLFLLLTLGIQENMAGVAVGIGMFLILRKERQLKVGIATIFLGLVYGLLVIKLIIPAISGFPYKYQPDLPVVWHEWLTRFILPVDLKLRTIALTYATFGLLPVFAFSTLPLVIAHFLERFVLNSAATRWDLGFHYNVLLSPIMFLGTLEVITQLQIHKKWRRLLPIWGIATIALVLFLHRFYLHGPLMLATHPVFYEQTARNKRMLDGFVSQIPRSGLLMTMNNLAAHFTHQEVILLHRNYKNIQPDVVALDLRPGQNANNFYPLSFDETKNLVASLSADVNYEKRGITDSQFIYTRK